MMINLISWAHCKKLLSLDTREKAFLELLIFSATAEIENYTNRKLKQREMRELHNGFNQNEVLLKNYPVKEVSSLKVDNERDYTEETIVNKDYYSCFIPHEKDYEQPSEIILTDGYSFPRGRNNIEVIYTAGYLEEEVPEDLKTATVEMVEWSYKRLKNRQIGEVNLKYGQETQVATKMPEHVMKLLEPYRRKHW
ncbi:MAG: hypothetical protein PQJ61_00430 [Spirochaetales bacterium]|uniref:Phage gp6-like head-tail connector protein n=1 Tax=Candidatus Thalassospirochaeta sargassi TaxID=3119039 RepID=A0AAJ1I9Q0_9SPIO|nr:hypothetical protein [Spirochaetales bacterium]